MSEYKTCPGNLKLLAEIFKNIPRGLILADQEGLVQLVNNHACELLQASPAELEGKRLSHLPGLKLGRHMELSLESGIPCQEVSISAGEEEMLPEINLDTQIIREPGGRPLGIVGIIRRTSHFSRTTAFVLDAMKSGVIVIDQRERLIYYNRHCEMILNLDGRNILGKPYTEVFHMIPPEEQYTALTLRTGHEYRNLEHEHFTRKGTYLMTDTYLIKDEQGQVTGAVGIFKEITDLKQFHREHEEYVKLSIVNQIAAGMAHEIRNPLTSIKGYVQMSQSERVPDNSINREFGNIVLRDIMRIEHLITCFLHLAEPSKPRLLTLNMNELAGSVINELSNSVAYNNVRLRFVPEPHLPLIKGDAQQLATLLQALLFNAADSTHPGGTITVSTSSHQGVELRVNNSGELLSSQARDEIFNPFGNSRVSPVSLAMSVVKGLVDSHGGTIGIDSHPERGTTVSCNFPPAVYMQ